MAHSKEHWEMKGAWVATLQLLQQRFFFLLLLVLLVLLCFVYLFCLGERGDGDGRWAGLGSMIRNLQRIKVNNNKKFTKTPSPEKKMNSQHQAVVQ